MTERPRKSAKTSTTEDALVDSAAAVDPYLPPKDSARLSMVSRAFAQELYNPVPPLYRTWQNEFDRCSPLQGPGIAQVIQLKQERTEDDERYTPQPCVAFVLKDGSLWRTNPMNGFLLIGWPDFINPEFGSPYLTVHRMFPHLKKITTADFAGARGVILAESRAHAVKDGIVEEIILPSSAPVLLAARDHNSTIVITSDMVLHTISDDDDKPIPTLQLNQKPTHAAIIGSTVLLATADDVHYCSTMIDEHITWKQSPSPVHLTFSKCALALQAGDTIKELVTSDYYAAVLTEMGDVFVFGKRMPCWWSDREMRPNATDCKIILPNDRRAKSISCCTTRMAIVTTDDALYTCAVTQDTPVTYDEDEEDFPVRSQHSVARTVTAEQPRYAFHEATQLPFHDNKVKEAYCTDQYGITVVTTSNIVYHFKEEEDEQAPRFPGKRDDRWLEIGSRWYLMQDVMQQNSRFDENINPGLYALRCWVHAVLVSDNDAKSRQARLQAMMTYDYTHRGNDGTTRRVHPILYLGLIGDGDAVDPDLPLWVTLDEQNLYRVRDAMNSVFVPLKDTETMKGWRETQGGLSRRVYTYPAYWPDNRPGREGCFTANTFIYLMGKYAQDDTIRKIMSSLLGYNSAQRTYDLQEQHAVTVSKDTEGVNTLDFRIRLRLV